MLFPFPTILNLLYPLVFFRFCKPALPIPLLEIYQPLIIRCRIRPLLPRKDLEHAGLLISWDVMQAMPNFRLLWVDKRRGLPHLKSKTTTKLFTSH
jgi:hypothetical protein